MSEVVIYLRCRCISIVGSYCFTLAYDQCPLASNLKHLIKKPTVVNTHPRHPIRVSHQIISLTNWPTAIKTWGLSSESIHTISIPRTDSQMAFVQISGDNRSENWLWHDSSSIEKFLLQPRRSVLSYSGFLSYTSFKYSCRLSPFASIGLVWSQRATIPRERTLTPRNCARDSA